MSWAVLACGTDGVVISTVEPCVEVVLLCMVAGCGSAPGPTADVATVAPEKRLEQGTGLFVSVIT